MADESAHASAEPAVRSRIRWLRRGLLLAGLAIAGWAATRVVLLLSGNGDLVVANEDRHGYLAIFSLVLLPVLVVAIATLVADTIELWRQRGRSFHVGPGVALALSAPLTGPLVLAAVVIGVAIVVAALADRRHAGR